MIRSDRKRAGGLFYTLFYSNFFTQAYLICAVIKRNAIIMFSLYCSLPSEKRYCLPIKRLKLELRYVAFDVLIKNTLF